METTEIISTVDARRPEREAETPELLAKYLAHIGRGELLTHQEEIDLSKRAKRGDEKARRRLIEKNRKMARAYNELSAELEREPGDEEVAGRLGWTVEEVRDVKDAMPDATS